MSYYSIFQAGVLHYINYEYKSIGIQHTCKTFNDRNDAKPLPLKECNWPSPSTYFPSHWDECAYNSPILTPAIPDT